MPTPEMSDAHRIPIVRADAEMSDRLPEGTPPRAELRMTSGYVREMKEYARMRTARKREGWWFMAVFRLCDDWLRWRPLPLSDHEADELISRYARAQIAPYKGGILDTAASEAEYRAARLALFQALTGEVQP